MSASSHRLPRARGWKSLPAGEGRFAEVGARPSGRRRDAGYYVRTWAEPSVDVHGLAGGSGPRQDRSARRGEGQRLDQDRPGQNVADVSAASSASSSRRLRARTSRVKLHSVAEPGLVSPDAPALRARSRSFRAGIRPALAARARRRVGARGREPRGPRDPDDLDRHRLERRQCALAEREVSREVPDARSRGGGRDVQASRGAWRERRSRARSRSSRATCSIVSSATCGSTPRLRTAYRSVPARRSSSSSRGYSSRSFATSASTPS